MSSSFHNCRLVRLQRKAGGMSAVRAARQAAAGCGIAHLWDDFRFHGCAVFTPSTVPVRWPDYNAGQGCDRLDEDRSSVIPRKIKINKM